MNLLSGVLTVVLGLLTIYLGDVARRHWKYKVMTISPDKPTKEKEKWAWEFWR